jgi:hypothetical protein
LFSGWASADPPSRVARLGATSGAVSFLPSGESDWERAAINRPLANGDRIWSDRDARAEIQVGAAMVRLDDETSVSVVNHDDQVLQLQLTQGTLKLRVRRIEPNQIFEIDTPNLAFTVPQAGDYRIEVDPNANSTTIVVRKGRGEVHGDDTTYSVDPRQPYRFFGTGLRDYQLVAAPPPDEFDNWANARDDSYDRSVSARYVSQDVVGYQDLDTNGTWRVDPSYGNVWVPTRVVAGWAPYRDGHWAWVAPWGWTWVDDAPWGFAVSHYGRWANIRGTWVWVPGPVRAPAYYAPALVAFVGGDNFRLSISSGQVGAVGWFPLGPRDVYRPPYAASRRYFENVNRSNTVINNTVIINSYNDHDKHDHDRHEYANRHVPGAVIAVPKTTFAQSQPVSHAAVRLAPDHLAGAPVTTAAPVAPNEKHMRRGAAPGNEAPARVFERPVSGRVAPPESPLGFAAPQRHSTEKPGAPLADVERKEGNRGSVVPAPSAERVAPSQPTVRTPPALPVGRFNDGRGRPEETVVSAKVPSTAPQAPPSLPAASPAEPRGRDRQRDQANGSPQAWPPQRTNESRAPQAQALPAPAPAVTPTQKASPPQAVPPVQVAPSSPAESQPARSFRAPVVRAAEPQPIVAEPRPVMPQRAAEPRVIPQPAAVPLPAQQAPQRQESSSGFQPRHVAPPPSAPQPATRPEPAAPPVARRAENHPPVATQRPAPAPSAPKAEPEPQKPQPADARQMHGRDQRDDAQARRRNGPD